MALHRIAVLIDDYKHTFNNSEYKALKKETRKGETVQVDVPSGDDIALVRGNDEFLEWIQDDSGSDTLDFLAYYTGMYEGEELYYDDSKAVVVIEYQGKTYDQNQWINFVDGVSESKKNRLTTIKESKGRLSKINLYESKFSKTILDAYKLIKKSKAGKTISKLGKIDGSDEDVVDEFFTFIDVDGDEVTVWTDSETGELTFEKNEEIDDISLSGLKSLTESVLTRGQFIILSYDGTNFPLDEEEANTLLSVLQNFKSYRKDEDVKAGEMTYKVHANKGVEVYDDNISHHSFIPKRDFDKIISTLNKLVNESSNEGIIRGDKIHENIIKDLGIKNSKEFGKKFKEQIQQVVKENGGKYVGYFFSMKDDAIAIITTKRVAWYIYNEETNELEPFRETMIHESVNINDVNKFQEIKAPYVSVGTAGSRYVVIAVAMPEKEKWYNGYFENADKAMKWMVYGDGKVQLLRIAGGLKKFKDTKVKSAEEAVKVIQKYIDSI